MVTLSEDEVALIKAILIALRESRLAILIKPWLFWQSTRKPIARTYHASSQRCASLDRGKPADLKFWLRGFTFVHPKNK